MQKTVKQEIQCTGEAITGDFTATITLYPAEPDTGIVFLRKDLPGSPQVECRAEYAQTGSRWTSLVKGNVQVEHTEHLLAALACLEIDNVQISMDSPHIPVLGDFSSRGFVEALGKGGLQTLKKAKKPYVVQQPEWIIDSFTYSGTRYESVLLALPSEHLELTYLLDYPGGQLNTQIARFSTGAKHDPALELAPARSFIMDFEYQLVAGLIGSHIKKVLPATGGELRWENEPARHKLLDLLGDLYTIGRPVRGHFIGIRTGHQANIQMCKRLIGRR